MKRCVTFVCLALTCVLLLSESVPISVGAEPLKGAVGDSSLYAVVSEEMEQICKKGELSLFASLKTGEFAVKSEVSGKLWHSNPPDRYDDPFSGSDRVKTFSQLVLHYIDDTTLVEGYTTSYEAEAAESIAVAKQADGITITYKFFDLRIAVPLQITLTEQGLRAEVNVTEILEDSDKRLLDIGILPYFNAGGAEDSGYLVVPDGCGALIDFNNGRQNLASYSEPIYGRDQTMLGDAKTKLSENSALPLFGMKNGEQGFAAIITDGEAVASVVAGVSKKGSGYNNVYAEFELRSVGTVELSGKEMQIYEEGDFRVSSCGVEYRLLTDDKADYTGIAKEYAAYLRESGVSAAEKKTVSLLMEVYGAVRLDRSVLGIPTKVTKSLTSFAQAGEMAEQLKLAGVSSLTMVYSNYDRASLRGKLQTKLSPDGKLGGNGGYKKLKRQLDEMGVSLVSNVNLNTYQSGWFKSRNAAQTLGGLPNVTYTFDLSTNEPNMSVNPIYYLSPSRFLKTASRFAKKYNEEQYGAIGLDNLAQTLYSDFSKSHSYGRQQTLELFTEGVKSLADTSSLYARDGAAWMLPYIDYIYDIPSDTSRTDLENRAIPLYQLAISGIIPYSSEAVNRAADPDYMVLKCAEYGADLKYDLTYESPGITGDSTLGYLNGVWFRQWQEHAVVSYERLSALSEVLAGEMLRHEEVSDNVFVTTYRGGRVAVNYRDEDVRIGDTVVKAKDFSLLKEADRYGG